METNKSLALLGYLGILYTEGHNITNSVNITGLLTSWLFTRECVAEKLKLKTAVFVVIVDEPVFQVQRPDDVTSVPCAYQPVECRS